MPKATIDPRPTGVDPPRPSPSEAGTPAVIPAAGTDADGRRLPARWDAPGPTPAAAEPATPTTDSGPKRALKLVLTLRPGEGSSYHALIALGADGCDPLLRTIIVADLPAALDAAAALAAEADARWQLQPRYQQAALPTARPAATGSRSGAARHPASAGPITTAPPPAEAVPASPLEPPDIPPAPKPQNSGQLSLFG